MAFIASAIFPDSVWDGLTFQFDSIQIDKDPSFFWKDSATQEIRALEQYLIDRGELFEFFDTLGPANSVVGVKIDSSGLTYRELVAGSGVTIDHTDDATTISATGGGATSTVNMTNVDTGSVVIATPVYTFGSGTFKKGKANTQASIRLVGLAASTIAQDSSGSIQTDGVVTASTGEWDALTGDSGGLTSDTKYYLSETEAGKLKTIPPTSGYVVPVGYAVSTTQLKLNLNTIVLL